MDYRTVRAAAATAALLLAVCVHAPVAQSQQFSIEDALNQVVIGYVAVSPHAQWVAYTACPPVNTAGAGAESLRIFAQSGFESRFGGCRVRVVELATKRRRELPLRGTISLAAAWRPGHEDELAVYSDHDGFARPWLVNVRSGARRRLSAETIRAFDPSREGTPAWSPDGSWLLIKAVPRNGSRDEADAAIERALLPSRPRTDANGAEVFSAIRGDSPQGAIVPSFRAIQYQGDFMLISADGGKPRTLSSGANGIFARFSPDGRLVAYQDFRGAPLGAASAHAFEAVIADVATGRPVQRLALRKPRYTTGFSTWSANSQWVAFGDCQYLAVDGKSVVLTPGEGIDCGTAWDESRTVTYAVGNRQGSEDVTVWEADPGSRSVTSVISFPGQRGQLLMPRTHDRVWTGGRPGALRAMSIDPESKETMFYELLPQSGAVRVLHRLPMWLSATVDTAQRDLSADHRALVFVGETSTKPSELWLATDRDQAVESITEEHTWTHRYRFGQTRMLNWRGGLDGRLLRGTLVLPAEYNSGRKYPLVVIAYGTATLSNARFRFGGDSRLAQLLATRNIATLLPDSYVEPGQNVQSIVKSILPGVDAAIAAGVADESRVGLYGSSYGGYTVLALLTNSDRFRAAVTSAGAYDPIRSYLTMSPAGDAPMQFLYERGALGMGGDLWSRLSAFVSNNPVFRLDQVKAPLLLLHGSRDLVPTAQAEAVYVGLRRLGLPVEYVRYSNVGHSFYRSRADGDSLRRTLEWFEMWFGDRSPSALKRGGAESLAGEQFRN